MTSVEDFDPNAAKKPFWGVYDGYKFYTYEGRGHALLRLDRSAPAKLFELTPTGWELRAYRRDEPKSNCDCCAKAIGPADALRQSNQWNSTANQRHQRPYWPENYRADRHSGKVKTPFVYLFACKSCIRARGL